MTTEQDFIDPGYRAPNTGPFIPWATIFATKFPPLSTELFVDPGTAIPVAQQTGSIAAPFSTIQRAINRARALELAGAFAVGIRLVPGTYTENLAFAGGNYFFDCNGFALLVGNATFTDASGAGGGILSKNLVWGGSLTTSDGGAGTGTLSLVFCMDDLLGAAPSMDNTLWTGDVLAVLAGTQIDTAASVTPPITGATTVLRMMRAQLIGDTASSIKAVFYGYDSMIANSVTVTAAPLGPASDQPGFIGCSFSIRPSGGAPVWTGPASSFLADGETLGTFLLAGGTFAGGATLVKTDQTIPLSRKKNIDPQTTIATARQTGAADAPFVSIVAWLASLGVATSANEANAAQIGLMTPPLVASTETPTFPAYRNVMLSADAFASSSGAATWTNTLAAAGVGAVAPTTAVLALRNFGFAGLTITDDGTVGAALILESTDRLAPFLVAGNIVATGATKLTSIQLGLNAVVTGAITSTADANGATVFYGSGSRVSGNITAKAIGSSTTPAVIIGGGSLFGGTAFQTAAASPQFWFGARFSGANPVCSAAGAGTGTATFDSPSWRSFQEAGGTVTAPMVALVVGGFRAGTVVGANLTDADVTVSLDGGGATAGFTAGGNYYPLPAATLGAGRVLTLGNSAAKLGDTICVDRRDLSANTYTIKDAAATTLYVFAISTGGTFVARFNGTNWVRAEVGNTLT